jgi:putative ABC transport system substrate-binding protein
MGRRKFIRLLSAVAILAFWVGPAFAQSAVERPLVGVLFPGQIPSPRIDAFLQGLADNGCNEGRNIALIIRAAAFDNSRLSPFAKELIQSHVDILVTSSSPGVIAAQAATRTVPIVFATIADPVALGVAKSLAHPGGNITGITLLSPDINGKRLALIKETLPGATKIAILQNPTNPATTIMSREVETVARSLGLEARTFAAARPEQFNEIVDSVAAWSADAIMPLDDFLFDTNGVSLAASASRHALPLVCGSPEMAAAGCLFTYGVDIPANYRQAASLVAKILKGAKPADLPIENPTRFQTIVNLKVAKTLGLSVPTSILLRADEVIE